MKLKKQLGDEILAYCKLNEITDTSAFLNKVVEAGFNLEKYGNRPMQERMTQLQGAEMAKKVSTTFVTPVEKITEEEAEKVMSTVGKSRFEIKPIKSKPIEEDDYDVYD